MSLATMAAPVLTDKHGHAICGRPTRQGDHSPCEQRAGKGTDHVGEGPCGLHGGHLPVVRNASRRKLAERRAVEFLADVDIEPIGDPLAALAEHVAWTRALHKAVGDSVGQIPLSEWETLSAEDSSQLRADATLLKDLTTALSKMLTDWVRLGFDERLVRIDEAKAALCLAAIEAAVATLDLSPTDLERFMAAIAAEFDRRSR